MVRKLKGNCKMEVSKFENQKSQNWSYWSCPVVCLGCVRENYKVEPTKPVRTARKTQIVSFLIFEFWTFQKSTLSSTMSPGISIHICRIRTTDQCFGVHRQVFRLENNCPSKKQQPNDRGTNSDAGTRESETNSLILQFPFSFLSILLPHSKMDRYRRNIEYWLLDFFLRVVQHLL